MRCPRAGAFAAGRAGGDGLVRAALTSTALGLSAAAVSVIAALIWLETTPSATVRRTEGVMYLPLLIPQIAFLFGLQILLIWLGMDGRPLTLLWVHVVFVVSYVMLSLGPTGGGLMCALLMWRPVWGRGPQRFWAVKLPMLLIPLLAAFAVGFAVSQALYLPTVFASNGRVATLTTEAVTLASGAGRQTLGSASALQMALPLMVFLGADFIGRIRFRRFSWFGV